MYVPRDQCYTKKLLFLSDFDTSGCLIIERRGSTGDFFIEHPTRDIKTRTRGWISRIYNRFINRDPVKAGVVPNDPRGSRQARSVRIERRHRIFRQETEFDTALMRRTPIPPINDSPSRFSSVEREKEYSFIELGGLT